MLLLVANDSTDDGSPLILKLMTFWKKCEVKAQYMKKPLNTKEEANYNYSSWRLQLMRNDMMKASEEYQYSEEEKYNIHDVSLWHCNEENSEEMKERLMLLIFYYEEAVRSICRSSICVAWR